VTSPLQQPQKEALKALGIPDDRVADVLNGIAVAYPLETDQRPGIAVIQLVPPRLRSGIVALSDRGGGVKTLARFRARSVNLARAFALEEIELFGAAIVNQELRAVLLRRGFREESISVPEELGGGTTTILTRVYRV
jgi:hypothetical protein